MKNYMKEEGIDTAKELKKETECIEMKDEI